MPVDDDCFGKTTIREDGRNLTPAYLFEVKTPSESKGPWDYYKLIATTPGDAGVPPVGRWALPVRQGLIASGRHAALHQTSRRANGRHPPLREAQQNEGMADLRPP